MNFKSEHKKINYLLSNMCFHNYYLLRKLNDNQIGFLFLIFLLPI